MNTVEHSKLQNEEGTASTVFDTLPVYPNQPQDVEKHSSDSCRRVRQLAIVEMVLSFLMVVLGIISTSLANSDPVWNPMDWFATLYCFSGSSIYLPALGVAAASLGLCALNRRGTGDKKCLEVAHFIMSIVGATASGILILISGNFLQMAQYGLKSCHYECAPKELFKALLALQVLIVLLSLAHMISCIVSTAFLCGHWGTCSRNRSAGGTTVIYVPSQTSNVSGSIALQPVIVPAGAQVRFA